jgi:hypothetical protein
MFKKEDFDHIEKMRTEMADGMTDGSDSHFILEKIVNIMSATDFTSDEDRMTFMMQCINLCYEDGENSEDILVEDNVFGVILALCFNYSNIISNLIADGFNIEDYYSFLMSEVLPVMREESKSLPYWEINE